MASLLDEILRKRGGAAALLAGNNNSNSAPSLFNARPPAGAAGVPAPEAGPGPGRSPAGMLPAPSMLDLAARLRLDPGGGGPTPAPAPPPAAVAPAGVDPELVQQAQAAEQRHEGRRAGFQTVAVGLVDSLDLPEEGKQVLRADVARTLNEPTAGEDKEGILSRIMDRAIGLNDIPGADALSAEQRKGFRSRLLITAGLVGLGGNASIWDGLLFGIIQAREEAANTAGQKLDEQANQQFWGRINGLAPLPEDATYEQVQENLQAKLQMSVEAAGRGVKGAAGAVEMFEQQIEAARDTHEAGIDREFEAGQAELERQSQMELEGLRQAGSDRRTQATIGAANSRAAAARALTREQFGAEQAAEAAAAAEQELARAEGKRQTARIVTDEIDLILPESEDNPTGHNLLRVAGGIESRLNPFDTQRLNNSLDTIKSNVGLNKLIEVKEQGGTFGALSDSELSLLIDSAGKLDATMPEQDLERNLRRVRKLYAKALDGGAGASAALPSDEDILAEFGGGR